MKSWPGFARQVVVLASVGYLPIFPQQAPQPPAPTDVIRWKEGGPGAETLHLPNVPAHIRMLTANGMVVAAAVDHGAGDVDLSQYGKSILRAQIKVTNTTSGPVTFDAMAGEVRDSERSLAPLSFSEVLKLAQPIERAPGFLPPTGPAVYNPGAGGTGATGQEDLRRDAERTHAEQEAQRQRGNNEVVVAPMHDSSKSRQGLSAFYAARRIEPGQYLIGFVYFKAPKLSKEFVLRIPVGQTVYEIPFSNPK